MTVVLWILPLCGTALPLLYSLFLHSVPVSNGVLCPIPFHHQWSSFPCSPDHLLVPKRWMLTQCFSVSVSVVMNTEIDNWSYLGALVREKTSCYKPFEVTVSLLTIEFSCFINGTKKAVFYHEDHSLPMPENCSVVHSWVGAQVLAYYSYGCSTTYLFLIWALSRRIYPWGRSA